MTIYMVIVFKWLNLKINEWWLTWDSRLLDTLIRVIYIATKWLVHESFMDKSSSWVGCIFPQICFYIGFPELLIIK